MKKEKAIKPVMEVQLEYFYVDADGREEKKKALAKITDDELHLCPELGEPLRVSLREITNISEADYRISLELGPKEKIVLSELGYQYEDFLRAFMKVHNRRIAKDMLMDEPIKISGIEAEFFYADGSGQGLQKGNAELIIYETALLVIPVPGDFIRIPFGNISGIEEGDCRLVIKTVSGNALTLTKLGEQFDLFKKTISEGINDLSEKNQEFFKELVPGADASLLRKVSQVMKDGQAVERGTLISVSSELFSALEKKIEDFGMKEEYGYLSSIADKEKISLGSKQGLMGDLTGNYFWFLIPIYDLDNKKPGNAIAMEATTATGTGKSTYFFRILPRRKYRDVKNITTLRQEVDGLIEIINKAMIDINFRREPIYLSDEKLSEPQYFKYKIAVEKIPNLRILRALFIGRVAHHSVEQWQADVNDLLAFNVTETDDSKKWENARAEEDEGKENK
ncbi:MAG: hypothetical protein WCQ96_02635 [Patescibacteria group bacterium]